MRGARKQEFHKILVAHQPVAALKPLGALLLAKCGNRGRDPSILL